MEYWPAANAGCHLPRFALRSQDGTTGSATKLSPADTGTDGLELAKSIRRGRALARPANLLLADQRGWTRDSTRLASTVRRGWRFGLGIGEIQRRALKKALLTTDDTDTTDKNKILNGLYPWYPWLN
jgi:hypothetical protein